MGNRRTASALVVLALTATAIVQGSAAADPVSGREVVIKDEADDANGANSQGEKGAGSVDVPTGDASVDGADLRRVTLSPIFERTGDALVRTGSSVRFEVAAPPDDTVAFLLDGRTSGCERVVLVHDPDQLPGAATTRFSATCDDQPQTSVLPDAVVEGSSVTVTVPDDVLPLAIGERARLAGMWAETSNAVGPMVRYDTAASDATFELRTADIPVEDEPTVDPTTAEEPANAAASTNVRRIAGGDRIATSVAVARDAHAAGATVAVLARSSDYPDALAASSLTGLLDAPVLLTGSARLDGRVVGLLRELDTQRVVLLGGPTALSRAVEEDVRAAGVERVERLSGDSRFATAVEVARTVRDGLPGDTVIVTEGTNADPQRGWPDAVAASALAARSRTPILLTAADTLHDETREYLATASGLARAVVVGGRTAVSDTVVRQLEALGLVVERRAGTTRYDTSVEVGRATLSAGASRSPTWLVTGRDWPDALAAGPAAAAADGVLLLVDGQGLDGSPSIRGWLAEGCPDVVLVGGEAAVRPATSTAVTEARDC